MPAISEDAVSSSEERDSDTGSTGKRKNTRSTPIRVVGDKRERFLPGRRRESTGQYDDSNGGWMVLTTKDDGETGPLMPKPKRSVLTSLKRQTGPLMCILALVTFTMAGLVCVVWAVPGAFRSALVIAPNDTVLAAYELDTQDIDYVTYSLPATFAPDNSSEDKLVFYREACHYIDPSSVEVDISDDIEVPADVTRIKVSQLYLATHSSLDYTVALTLSTPEVPTDCYASLHQFKDHSTLSSFMRSDDRSGVISSKEFCNASTIHFTLEVSKDSYYFLALSAHNPGQVKSVNLQASGTIFYFDSSLYDRVCQISPGVNSTCKVAIGHLTDYDNLCVLITRGTPHIPGTDPTTIAAPITDTNDGHEDDDVIIQLESEVTTYWAVNRLAVFLCLFIPLMISCCIFTLLIPRKTNYGAYVWTDRRQEVN